MQNVPWFFLTTKEKKERKKERKKNRKKEG